MYDIAEKLLNMPSNTYYYLVG